jgi:hypothetical protein
MLTYPYPQFFQLRAEPMLGLKGDAELRLSARSPQEEDQILGDFQRNVLSQVLANQGESKVNSSRDAG